MSKNDTPIQQIKDMHHYVLTRLYAVQDGKTGEEVCYQSEDYWRGTLQGTESVMDVLGIEYERYNPLHD